MYGQKSEIQRIQAKLQRIGKANPYRPHFNEVSRNEVHPFISTSDRYHTPAGQKALKEMGEVVRLPDPLPEAVTFLPQSPWTNSNSPWTSSPWLSQISIVDSEASKRSHQLAHRLRQQSYASDSSGYERGYVGPTADSAQVDWHRDASGNSSRPHREVGEWFPGHISSWGTHSRFSLAQGLMWFVGAVVIRMGIDRLLGAFPNLWVVMAAMVLTPVAIALYQTAVNPQATVHSGRRLLVIMMGLLIGGQL